MKLSYIFARYFGLQNKPSSGLKKKSEYNYKTTVTYMGLKYSITENDRLRKLQLFTSVFKIFTDPCLHKIRHSSLVCRCGFSFSSSI